MILAKGIVVQAITGGGDIGLYVDTSRPSISLIYDEDGQPGGPQIDVEKPSVNETAPRIDLIFSSKQAVNDMIQALFDIRAKTFGCPALPACIPAVYSAVVFKQKDDAPTEVEAVIVASLDAPDVLLVTAENVLAAMSQPPSRRV